VSWDTSSVSDGSHVLSAVASDSAGNTSTVATESLTVANNPPVDSSVTAHGKSSATTGALSTTGAGDLVVAFVAVTGGTTQRTSVTGGGLTWSLVQRANTSAGDAEIWSARASSTLQSVTFKAKARLSGTDVALSVLAFNASSGVGGSAGASAATGPAKVSLTTQTAGSWTYAVGDDPHGAVARSLASGQQVVDQWVDASKGVTTWVQAGSPSAPAGSTLVISDTAPTADPWNFAAVEITR
jgi:hypothetical protein